jgi:diguanylate cyclase (GGDEF)-like protein
MRLRLVIGCSVVAVALWRMQGGVDRGSVAMVIGALVVPSIGVVEHLLRGRFGAVIASVAALTADIAVVFALVWAAEVRLDEPATIVLALPLIEAGMRHGVRGLIVAWLAVSFLVAGWTLQLWGNSSVDVHDPVTLIGVLLLTALPAANLSQHLVERIDMYAQAHALANRRALLLARVVHGAGTVVSDEPASVEQNLLAAATTIIGPGARVELVPNTADTGSGAPVDGTAAVARQPEGTLVTIHLGADWVKRLVCRSREQLDDVTVEALEVLCAHARIAHAAARRQAQSREVADRWARKAHTDPLTGLLNRAGLFERLAARLDRPDRGRVAVLFADVDGLKQVNDEFGHDAGDELLRVAAERMMTKYPHADIGRIGGDEFVLLVDLDDDQDVHELGLQIEASVFGHVSVRDDVTAAVALSIGAAVAGVGERPDLDELIGHADARMYVSKQARRERRARQRRLSPVEP